MPRQPTTKRHPCWNISCASRQFWTLDSRPVPKSNWSRSAAKTITIREGVGVKELKDFHHRLLAMVCDFCACGHLCRLSTTRAEQSSLLAELSISLDPCLGACSLGHGSSSTVRSARHRNFAGGCSLCNDGDVSQASPLHVPTPQCRSSFMGAFLWHRFQ